MLGPATKIGYAADWSEYFGHQPADGSGDVLFHLDPLWAHRRDRFRRHRQLHAAVGLARRVGPRRRRRPGRSTISAISAGNVAGGEGFDWYYADAAGREAQERLPIADGAYGEDWVFRYKDLVSWWSRPHVNRLGGVKAGGADGLAAAVEADLVHRARLPGGRQGHQPAERLPRSEVVGELLPLLFERGAGRLHPVSLSAGELRALERSGEQSAVGRLCRADGRHGARARLGLGRAAVAGLSRPAGDLGRRRELRPRALAERADQPRGAGRGGGGDLRAVADWRSSTSATSTARVTGYTIEAVESARQSLQPLMLAYGFDSFAAEGRLAFANRGGPDRGRDRADGCVAVGGEPVVALTRSPAAETAGRVTLGFVRADMDYLPGAVEALGAGRGGAEHRADQPCRSCCPRREAQAIAERWLSEGRVARDTLACALPPSRLAIDAGRRGVGGGGRAGRPLPGRSDRGASGHRAVERRADRAGGLRGAGLTEARATGGAVTAAPTPVHAEFLDLPLLTGRRGARTRRTSRWRDGPGRARSRSTRRARTSATR